MKPENRASLQLVDNIRLQLATQRIEHFALTMQKAYSLSNQELGEILAGVTAWCFDEVWILRDPADTTSSAEEGGGS